MAVHLGLFGMGLTCALYNLGAWCCMRESKNRNNALVYGALVLYEARQVMEHAKEM